MLEGIYQLGIFVELYHPTFSGSSPIESDDRQNGAKQTTFPMFSVHLIRNDDKLVGNINTMYLRLL